MDSTQTQQLAQTLVDLFPELTFSGNGDGGGLIISTEHLTFSVNAKTGDQLISEGIWNDFSRDLAYDGLGIALGGLFAKTTLVALPVLTVGAVVAALFTDFVTPISDRPAVVHQGLVNMLTKMTPAQTKSTYEMIQKSGGKMQGYPRGTSPESEVAQQKAYIVQMAKSRPQVFAIDKQHVYFIPNRWIQGGKHENHPATQEVTGEPKDLRLPPLD